MQEIIGGVWQRRKHQERCGDSEGTKDAAQIPFIGHGHGPTVRFTPAVIPRFFPTHIPRGNCPTASSGFRLVQELMHRGRASESMHDPLGLWSTRVPLF
jgi:hypothetical protein